MMKVQRLCLGAAWLTMCLTVSSAQATVIATNEWTDKTRPGWIYTTGQSGTGAAIDNGTNTPAGGGALQFVYPAGTQTQSISGGKAEFSGLTGTDIYVGHWMKFSTGFQWHPIGTKIDYQYVNLTQTAIGSTAAFTIRVDPGGARLALDITIQGNGQFTSLPHTVYSNQATPVIRGQWQWLEYHVKLNDVTGPSFSEVIPNGVLEVWIDDVLQASYNTLRFTDRIGQTWKIFQHSPEYGGGGTVTIPATQYLWVDHTVISTTRIGKPVINTDTTAPARPANFLVSQLMDWLSAVGFMASQWFALAEANAAR